MFGFYIAVLLRRHFCGVKCVHLPVLLNKVARRYDLQYRMKLVNQGTLFDDEEVGDGHEPRAFGAPRRAC